MPSAELRNAFIFNQIIKQPCAVVNSVRSFGKTNTRGFLFSIIKNRFSQRGIAVFIGSTCYSPVPDSCDRACGARAC